MIRYSLRCDSDHDFESWFRDSQAFDDQSLAGLVSCPICGSVSVSKSLMAPSVVTSRRKSTDMVPAPTVEPTASVDTAPVALLDEKAQKLRALMREFRDHVVKNSQDVGQAFPEEARKMHEGAIEQRAIRGEASPEDVRALIEDGIDIMPLPNLPDDRN
ncbi:DUF1178 family protein [Lichenifustis flavocetrariae]|uniref:DUF1178 family protein n=1 Tax=Lichenifustis flavocetrariae TaxID=2949735 RepID=A0AA41Z247_9HYPH|nr:DUF1178 family protein [Lichenifustis flavocetrariae]MCW6508950.1 DUF1178 family protein [Lichenifustis flavocetrariae]